jgi:hypothetical protein
MKHVTITIDPPVRADWDSGREVEQWEDYLVHCDGPGVSKEVRKIEHALTGPYAGKWGHEWSMGQMYDSLDLCLNDYRSRWAKHGWIVHFVLPS